MSSTTATATAAPPPLTPRDTTRPDRYAIVFDAAVLLLAVMSVARLAQQAAGAHFFTDECFHAHVAGWIAARHELPVRLPGFYAGLAYTYPPLFHLLGAASVAALGAGALRFLNVALWGALLAMLYGGLGSGLDRVSRRWAVVLCVTNHWLAVHAVRLYAEMLFATLLTLAGLLALRLCRTGRARDAVWLGASAGLLAITKPAGPIAMALLAGVAIVLAIAKRGAAARLAGLAAGVALVVVLPYWIRNQVVFGSAFYPLGAPDVDRELWKLTLEKYGVTPLRFYERVVTSAGPWVLGLTAIAALAVARRRRWDLVTAMLALCVVAMAVAPVLPIHDPRHVLPLLPLLALSASAIVAGALATRRPLARAVEAALLLIGIVHLGQLPEYRKPLDLPAHLGVAYAAVREHLAPGATILSLWTYDTFYYTGHPATWPVPWGQPVHPTGLFRETDPERFLAELDRDHVDALLVPLVTPPAQFDGANYPRSLVVCVTTLVREGRLSLLWSSRSLALVGRPAGTASRGFGVGSNPRGK